MAGFDQGQHAIFPINIGLILSNATIWWPHTSLWIIIPVGLALLFLTLDKYAGMFFATIILTVLLGMGLAYD